MQSVSLQYRYPFSSSPRRSLDLVWTQRDQATNFFTKSTSYWRGPASRHPFKYFVDLHSSPSLLIDRSTLFGPPKLERPTSSPPLPHVGMALRPGIPLNTPYS